MPASRDGGNPKAKMMKAIQSAKLETVAEIAGKESDDVVSALAEKGIAVDDPGMSVREIAKRNDMEAMEVIGLVFR